MKTITQAVFRLPALVLAWGALIGCGAVSGPRSEPDASPGRLAHNPGVLNAQRVVIAPPKGTPRPPFEFSKSDQALLDEIQHATFTYFMRAVSPETGMVYDRTSSDVVSIAGVGFQLAALPIGVERGWATRHEARTRARQIIDALMNEPSNRKAGLFYHFINPHDASARRVGRELVVSTVDSALLFAGLIVAGEYFQGDIKHDADALVHAADWSFFQVRPGGDAPDSPFLSLGWKPQSDSDPTGAGELLPYSWIDSGDEHRLTTLLAICAPDPDHRVEPSVYWNLRRQLGWHNGQGEIVWFPYSGALFTSFFAHLFIDYAELGVDDPAAHGVPQRARVDWWENSRRTVHLHRDRAMANPHQLPTLGPNAWGFSASDGPEGYLVSGQFPERVTMRGAVPERDFATYAPQDNWGDGVIAPYAPGTSIMFEPDLAIDALRHARRIKGPNGGPGIWRGDWGFADAYRLDDSGHADWVAEDFVAISQGPLLIGIENARTGLIWRLFMGHPAIHDGFARAGLTQPKHTQQPHK